MTFKKGDRVRTDDGQVGEILFIDRSGDEAQVALARISIKLRTETLEKVEENAAPVAAAAPKPAKKRAARR